MPEFSTDPQLVTLKPATVAVMREVIPMNEMPHFIDRAFQATMAAAQAQGIAVVGPPVSVYYGTPTTTVDMAAGFPTAQPVATSGNVFAMMLPGGRAVQMLHIGSYDSLGQSYERLMAWVGEQGLKPAEVMWEVYLTEPIPDAPESWQTLIVWPLAA